jgi:hypothetical protein
MAWTAKDALDEPVDGKTAVALLRWTIKQMPPEELDELAMAMRGGA